MDRIEERLDRIEERLDRLEKRVDKVEERLDKVETRLDKVEEQVRLNTINIKALEELVARFVNSVDKSLQKNDAEHEQFRQALGISSVKVL